MNCSALFLRISAPLAAVLPLVMLGAGCGGDDDSATTAADAGTPFDGAARTDSGAPFDGAASIDSGDSGKPALDGAVPVPPDVTAPTVLSSQPANAATGESPNGDITVTFSETMTGITNGATFTVPGTALVPWATVKGLIGKRSPFP